MFELVYTSYNFAQRIEGFVDAGFVDADYAGDRDKYRSLSGYLSQVLGCTVSWKASSQHIIALSSREAEYVALTESVKEAMWIQGITGLLLS